MRGSVRCVLSFPLFVAAEVGVKDLPLILIGWAVPDSCGFIRAGDMSPSLAGPMLEDFGDRISRGLVCSWVASCPPRVSGRGDGPSFCFFGVTFVFSGVPVLFWVGERPLVPTSTCAAVCAPGMSVRVVRVPSLKAFRICIIILPTILPVPLPSPLLSAFPVVFGGARQNTG